MLFFLASLLEPSLGIFFWTVLIFVLLWTLLGRFAWNPIANALKERENNIAASLAQAEKARDEMSQLQAKNEELLAQAQEERAAIIKEAREIKDSIVNEAKEKAKLEATRIVASAEEEINNQKMAAITEVKNLIGTYAISLAKQVISRDLDNQKAQESFIAQEIDKIELN